MRKRAILYSATRKIADIGLPADQERFPDVILWGERAFRLVLKVQADRAEYHQCTVHQMIPALDNARQTTTRAFSEST